MDTVEFLKTMLADDGMYCVFGIRASDNQPIQKFYSTIEVAAEAAKQLNNNGFNAYFALATFTSGGNRRVDNIKSIKSLFLDLDCGDKKAYPDQKAALISLQAFCKSLKLPRPLVVNSGRGLHVYWSLTEPATYADWLPVSEKLKYVTKEKGLLADPAVTADGARILRVPETNNYKDNPPHEVMIYQDGGAAAPVSLSVMSDLLGAAPPMPVPLALPSATNIGSALMDTLSGNKQGKFKNLVLKTGKGVGCEQMKIIITDQANIDEPLWRAGLSIAKHCVDSEKAAKLISENYPDYDEDETFNKLDLIKGPYLCSTFNEYNPDICTNCPHWGKIKSPIVLCQEVIHAEAEDNVIELHPKKAPELVLAHSSDVTTIPTYPKPYFRGKHGGIYVTDYDKDGTPYDQLIYENDFYVVGRLFDLQEGECVVMRLHLPNDDMREFNVPMTIVSSRADFGKRISHYGVGALGREVDALMLYVQAWIRELQQKFTADNAKRQFGWTDDNKGFILGDKCYTSNGVKPNYPSSATSQFFPAFIPKGTLEGWKQMANFYNREGLELHQWAMATAFGSPLMQFIDNVASAQLHIHSKGSGYGKTTAMLSGCSIYGNPNTLLVSDKDTKNFSMNRAEIYKNLPLWMDELTNAEPKDLSKMLYESSSIDARQRGRMSGGSNQERVRGEEWAFLGVSTGNTSILERIALYKRMPKAEAQRVLEYRLSGFKFKEGSSEVREFNKLLASNYGHAGPIYIQYLLDNQAEVEEDLRQTWQVVQNEFGLTEENRFWIADVTCCLVGTKIAIKLDLVDYDYNNLFEFARRLIMQNKITVTNEDRSTPEILVEFMNDHYNNILHTTSGRDMYSDDALSSFKDNDSVRGGRLVARYETDINKLYVIPKDLKYWCAENQINFASVMEDLTKEMGAKLKSVRLYKGTGMNLPPIGAIVLDFNYDSPESD